MAGFEDEDFLLRQFKQVGNILGNIVSQRSSDQVMHFDLKQSEPSKLMNANDYYLSKNKKEKTH